MIDNLVIFDQIITNYIYWLLPRNIFFDSLFLTLSFLGNYALVWIVFFGIFSLNKKTNFKKYLFIFISVLALSALISNYVLKYSFHRIRPVNNLKISQTLKNEIQGFEFPQDYSFPSGHAATSFALASILVYFDKKRKYLYFITAFLIVYSRIYLGVHYFFDIIVGALLGYLIALFTIVNIKNQKSNTHI